MIDLGVDEVRAAAVAIDCRCGHLDPKVTTMPAPANVSALLVNNNRAFLARCRNANIPVIHLATTYRDLIEIRSNPCWRSLADDPASIRKNAERYNLDGSLGCEIVLGLCDPAHDTIIETKKRYDCFIPTDLDFVLRASYQHAHDNMHQHQRLRVVHCGGGERARLRTHRDRGLRRYHGWRRPAPCCACVHPHRARLGDECRRCARPNC